jgi:CheY-like chemotaxis protein
MFAEQVAADGELRDARLILLTSAGQRGDAARCRELGVDGYLTKPVRQSELRGAISAVLGRERTAERTAPVTRHSLRETQLRSGRVLVAEDNAVNQRVVYRLLEKLGQTALVVSNGREAVDALEQQDFDLVLMDVQMPEMDGLEATAEIRRREQSTGKHQTIVAMTAHAMSGDRERCIVAGMDDYVSKPIAMKHITEILRRVQATPNPSAATIPDPTADLEDNYVISLS